MSECSNGFSQQMTEINCMNGKDGLDSWRTILQQGVMDNQRNARAHSTLEIATQSWSETLKVFAATGMLQAGQTGMTENQQQVTPSAQALKSAAEGSIASTDATVATANAAVAASVGNLATALVPIMQASAGNTTAITAEALASLLSVVITAAGGASTPSQTQAKPTA